MAKKQTEIPIENNEQEKEELPPIDKWIQDIKFNTTEDIKVPENLLDQVIGQDQTVAIVKKAAEQKRHVMLIGDPGTGKSMVARAMTEFLPKGNSKISLSIQTVKTQIPRRSVLSPQGKHKKSFGRSERMQKRR